MRARSGFCCGATACRATDVGLGLSLATIQQQGLGLVASFPVDMEAVLLQLLVTRAGAARARGYSIACSFTWPCWKSHCVKPWLLDDRTVMQQGMWWS